MKKLSLALGAALILSATPAMAGTVFSDNFDAENGGSSYLNYAGFTNFDVTGAVDLTKSGDYYACVGGTGSCVDLDGTPGPGKITSKLFYAFNSGDTVSLSFDLAGNLRGGPNDVANVSFLFSTPTDVSNYGIFQNGGNFSFGSASGATSLPISASLAPSDPFQTYVYYFTAASAGTVGFSFGTPSNDNQGPVLDNVSLDVSAVPEPATWGMMIAGFGLAGGALRRRRTTLACA